MNLDANLCCKCKQKITPRKAPGIQCNGTCRKFYHQKCANIPDDVFGNLREGYVSWACNSCRNKRQSLVIAESSNIIGSPSTSQQSLNAINTGAIGNTFDIESINSTLATVQAAQLSLQGAITNLSSAVNSFNQKVLELEQRLTVVESLKSENTDLKKRVKGLEIIIDDLERFKFSKAVEIRGIPFLPDEDVIKTVDVLAEGIGCSLETSDIDNIFRVGKTDLIILAFTSKLKQRTFLQNAKKEKPKLAQFAAAIGLKEDNKDINNNIYVNESVGKKTKLLLKTGRDLKRQKKLHSIGTENGIVICRTKFGGMKHTIKNLHDFKNIAETSSESYSDSN
jgi:hypothetical protein